MSIIDKTPETRFERRKRHTREQIKLATGMLMLEHGYAGLSVQKITERADIGYGTFYLHYHDIDDAVRAGLLREEDLPAERVTVLGRSSSERIGRMVTDVVHQTLAGGMSEIRMSDPILEATVGLRSFLFESVYENEIATAEFRKAGGILGGLWEKVKEDPASFLDARTIQKEGIDVAAKDFLAGMTDRYAVNLYEQLFIPKPWVSVNP